jgi:thiol-disulfide isomerase/thioredoxin
MSAAEVRLPVEGRMPSLDGATGWLQSPPLTPDDLRGHVVLVDFWTYTCVNWLRTAPYVRAWAEKYRDQGLVVIGVHTPEFGVEHDVDNVRRAVEDRMLSHAIALDNDYAIWNAFDNHYWPALYAVDAQGRIRYHRFGEGDYEESERVVQALLAEAGAHGVAEDLVSVVGEGSEAAADWSHVGSPETYVGYLRGDNFASPGGAVPDVPSRYEPPARLGLNHWALSGEWTIGREAAVPNEPGARLACRFHARDLNLAMGLAPHGGPVPFRVSLDGQPPGAAAGTDVDGDGRGTVSASRLYQLIRHPGAVTDRSFEIEFLDRGVEVLVFTFG